MKNFVLRLYPEHEKLLSSLEGDEYVNKYAYIKHDSDEGVEPHFHCLLVTKSDHTPEQVANALNIENRHILPLENGRKGICRFMRYLLHLDNNDKHRYDIGSIITNQLDWVDKAIRDGDIKSDPDELEAGHINIVLQLILDREIRSTTQLLQYAINNDCYGAVRRSYHMLKDCLREANMQAYLEISDAQKQAIEHLGTIMKAEEVAVHSAIVANRIYNNNKVNKNDKS